MPYQSLLAVGILFAIGFGVVPVRADAPKPPDQLPSIPELPNPFQFNDGSMVKSPQDWEKRRAELRELIQTYEYGHLPPVPGNVTATEYTKRVLDGLNATEHRFVLSMGPDHRVSYHMDLTIPDGKGPFPVIITGDMGWGKIKDPIVQDVIKRGYILCEFNRTEIAADKKNDRSGIYQVYPEVSDMSALAAWAWGYHRCIDYLLTRPDVDKAKIAITGHSRGGKTCLLAGAMDDRIALTAPNDSGCGGCGCFRHQTPKSEDIVAILKNFPYWFQPHFNEFIGKIDRLPIDQHEVKALVAPRAFLETEALGDLWANPEGSRLTFEAAREVYKFLGAGDKIGINYREGGHEQGRPDWNVLLDYADKVFLGKATDRNFDMNPFPDAKRPYGWNAPK